MIIFILDLVQIRAILIIFTASSWLSRFIRVNLMIIKTHLVFDEYLLQLIGHLELRDWTLPLMILLSVTVFALVYMLLLEGSRVRALFVRRAFLVRWAFEWSKGCLISNWFIGLVIPLLVEIILREGVRFRKFLHWAI